jgi:hypothetical protein
VFGEDIENLPETFLADVFECVLDNRVAMLAVPRTELDTSRSLLADEK